MKPELTLSLPRRRRLQESGIFVAYSHDASFRTGQLTAQKFAHLDPSCGTPASSTGHRKRPEEQVPCVRSPAEILQRLLSTRGYGSDTRIKTKYDQSSYDTVGRPTAGVVLERNWSGGDPTRRCRAG
jgi:hypothetical protein